MTVALARQRPRSVASVASEPGPPPRGGRPRDAGAHHRRSRRAARRRAGEDGAVEVVDHADLFGLPGHERDRARGRARARARPGIAGARVKTVLSPAWTTDWMQRRGPGASSPPTASPRRAEGERRPRAVRREAVACPRCGSQRHREARRVRLDRLQGALALPGLPRAVRPLQVHLRTSGDRRTSTRSPSRRSPRDAGRGLDRLRRAGRRSRRLSLHARPVPDPATARRRRGAAPLLLDLLGPRRRRAARRASRRSPAAASPAFVNETLRPGDALDVMTPDGPLRRARRPRRPRAPISASPAAPASRRSCRSSRACSPASRRAASSCSTATARPRAIMFREELEDLKDRFSSRLSVFHVLSREAQDVSILNGRIDGGEDRACCCAPSCRRASVDHAFVCGPGGMIDEAEAALEALGLRRRADPCRALHAGRGRRRPAGAAAASSSTRRRRPLAEVILDGMRHAFPVAEGEAIVDAALRAGPRAALLLQGRHVLHLPRQDGRGQVEMSAELLARALGDRGRLRPHLPVAAQDRAGGGRLRSPLSRLALGCGARVAAALDIISCRPRPEPRQRRRGKGTSAISCREATHDGAMERGSGSPSLARRRRTRRE